MPSTSINKKSSTVKYERLPSLLPKFIVVLLPSIGVNASQTDKLHKDLKENFGEEVTVIQIKSIERLKPIKIDLNIEEIEEHAQEILNEILWTLADRFHIKSSSEFQKDLNIPMHILGYGQSNLITQIKEQNYILSSSPLCNIQTLCIADVVENKIKKNGDVQFFIYNKDESIPDYITFLKEQQVKNEPIDQL